MATDHNFRIKNGLQVGSIIRIDSAGKFYPANIQNTSGPISFLNGPSAQGISVRDIYAGTTYANRTAAAGTIDALNGFKVAGTTVIDSARNLSNIGTIATTQINSTGYVRSTANGLSLWASGTDSYTQVGPNGGGASGVFGAHRETTGTNALDYTTYIGYDTYYDDGTKKWYANRTNLGRKWKTNFGGYHQNRFSISTYDGGGTSGSSLSAGWLEADWDERFGVDAQGNGAFAGTISSGSITSSGDGFFNGTKLEGDSKEIIRFNDSWLRLNPANEFTSGIYGGSGILRTDGHFQVGASGAKFSVNGITGNATVAGTISSGAITSTGDISANSGKVRMGNPTLLSGRSSIRIDSNGDSFADLVFGDSVTSTSWTNANWAISSRSSSESNSLKIFRASGQPSPYNSEHVLMEFKQNNVVSVNSTLQINNTTVIDASRNLTNIGAITSTGNSVFTGGNSDGTGNVFEVKRGGNSQQQALRIQNTGEVVISNNYLYAASGGTSFYSQGDAVFRANIRNDSNGGADPVKVSDALNITGNIQSNGTVILESSGRNLTNIGTISSGAITSTGNFYLDTSPAANGVGDLQIIPSANDAAGVGFAGQVFGVNISSSLSSNSPKQANTWGGVTGATAIALQADDNAYGQFQVWTSPQDSSANTVLTPRFWIAGNGNATFAGTITGTTATAAGGTNTTALANTAFVQQEITSLIGGAPTALDTLNELAAAINDDSNYNTTLTTALATKLPLAGGTMTGAITTNGHNIVVNSNTGLQTSGTATKFTTAHGYIQLGPMNTSHAHIYTDRTNFYFNKTLLYANGDLMWHAGNDGSGSGLDADLLDGQQGSYYAPKASPTFTGTVTLPSTVNGPTNDSTLTNVSAGWHTVASFGGARSAATVELWDSESSRHNFVKAEIGWSYGHGSINILNNVRHGSRTLARMRLMYNTSDQTYGGARLEVYLENWSTSYSLRLRRIHRGGRTGWGDITWAPSSGSVSGYAQYGQVIELGSSQRGTFGTSGKVIAAEGVDIYNGNQITFHTASGDGISVERGFIDAEEGGHLRIATSGGENIVFKDGGVGGTTNLTILGSGEMVKEATERFTIKSHSNGWDGGMRMISQDGTDTFQIHPDNNGYMYIDKNWYFANDVYIGSTTTKAWHSGNDGSGSGLDADLLDGQHGSYYQPADTTIFRHRGTVDVTSASGGSNNNPFDDAHTETKVAEYGTRLISYTGASATMLTINTSGSASVFQIGAHYNGNDFYMRTRTDSSNWQTWKKLWHAGNDGSGSGLDADLLDGQHASSFLTGNQTITLSGHAVGSGTTSIPVTVEYVDSKLDANNVNLNNPPNFPASGSRGVVGFYNAYFPTGSGNISNYNAPLDSGQHYHIQQFNGYSSTDGSWSYQIAHNFYNQGMFHRNQYNGTWQAWRKSWDSLNDGSGSGLDADLLDGLQGSSYVQQNTGNLIDLFANQNGVNELRLDNNRQDLSNVPVSRVSGRNSVEVGNMTFYRGGGGNSGFIRFQNKPTNDASLTDVFQVGDGATVGYGVDILAGGLRIGGNEVINSSRVMTIPQIKIGDGNDGYFYNDTAGRTAFAGGDFYIQNSVTNYYNYATNQYIGDSSGDNIHFRGNVLDGTGWQINGAGMLTTRDHLLNAGYHLQRADHHSGHLEGSYNNVGANESKSNPIYTIGSSYNPASTTLGNMYGVGFSYSNASFISFSGGAGWGMYVAADGDARVWLNGSAGTIASTGQHYVGSNVVWNAGNDGSGSGLDADLLDGQQGSYYRPISLATTLTGAVTGSGTTSISTSNPYQTSVTFQGSNGNSPDSAMEYTQAASVSDSRLAPTTDWYNKIRLGHGDPYNYYSNTIAVKMTGTGYGDLYTMTVSNNATGNWNKHWHANNDGSSSGLDADLLDGQHGSYYRSASNLNAGTVPTGQMPKILPTTGNYQWSASTAASGYSPVGISTSFVRGADGWPEYGTVLHVGGRGGSDAGGDFQLFSGHGAANGGNYLRVRNADNSASPTDAWTAFRTIWDSGNDGSGSGLAADSASTIYTTQTAGTNATHYPTFVSTNASGQKSLKYDPGMMYNPSTNTLGDVNFKLTGTLTGTASNADTLDGQHGSYYAQASLSNNKTYTSNGNAAGSYLGGHYSSGGTEKPNSSTFGSGKLKLAMLGSSNLGFGGAWNDVLWMSSYNGSDVKKSAALVSSKYNDSDIWIVKQNYDSSSWGTGYKIWTSGSDGSGSGLDADTLDGQHGSYYANEDARKSVPSSGNYQISNATAPATLGAGYLRHDFVNSSGGPPGSTYRSVLGISSYTGSNQWTQLSFNYNQGINTPIYFRQNQYNGSTWSSWHQLWDSANDGSGSGLDADLLDGLQASALVGTHNGHNRTINAEVGALHFYQDGGDSGQSNHAYAIYQGSGGWSSPYPDLRIGYHTGIQIGAHSSYGGTRFYNDYTMATEIMSIGNGDNHVRLATSKKLLFNGTTAYGIGAGGHNYNSGYFDTVESGLTTDALELCYYSGTRVNIGNGGGTKPLGCSQVIFGNTTSRSISHGVGHSSANAVKITGNWNELEIMGRVFDVTGSNCHFMDGYGSVNHASHYLSIGTGGGGNGGLNYMIVGTTLRVSGDVIAYYSDGRLKQNVKEIPNALDIVKNIRGVTYEWNKLSESVWSKKEGDEDFGLISQEVEAVFPMGVVVQGGTDVNREMGYADPESENYDPLHDGTKDEVDYKTVRYDKMVAVAIQAIKEQQVMIEELQKEIKELKNVL